MRFRCDQGRLSVDRCKATGVIDIRSDQFTLNQHHNHDPDLHRQEELNLHAKILQEAIDNPMEPAKHLFDRLTATHHLHLRFKWPRYESLIHKRRESLVPVQPTSRQNFIDLMNNSPLLRRHFIRTVELDGEIIGAMFSTDKLREGLGESSIIFYDATFRVVSIIKKSYYNFSVIHGSMNFIHKFDIQIC